MRYGVFAVATLWLMPGIAVGLIGLSLNPALAIIAAFLLAASIAWWSSSAVANLLAPVLARHPTLAVLASCAAAIAIVLIVRESIFIVDSTQSSYSMMSNDPWRVKHCCMTAYIEASRFGQETSSSVYDGSLYESRLIGTLKVDPYHYPPPFLLLPRALRAITTDFFRIRDLWFTMQVLTLVGALTGIALWIGGTIGAYALLGALVSFTTPTFIYALQMGNFQSTAVALAAIAFVLLLTQRVKTGAVLLAYAALSKIFPGILIVYLLCARRWRAVVVTSIAMAGLVALTVGVFGTRPFEDFLHREIPALSNGHAFPQSERPAVVASNQSIYGLTVRLRLLGATWLDQPTGLKIASFYGVSVLALAALAGWKAKLDLNSPTGRSQAAQICLALVSLASFRSPFVGGMYGYVATLWLLALLVAASKERRVMLLWSLAYVVVAVGNALTPSPSFEPSVFWLVASAVVFIVALCAGAWTILRLAVPRSYDPVVSVESEAAPV